MPQPEWISLPEATRLTGLSSRTLRRMVGEGQVKAVKTRGGHLRVSRDSVGSLLRPAAGGAFLASPVIQTRRERVEELRAEADELIAERQIKKLRAENAKEEQTARAESATRALAQERAAQEAQLRRAEERKRENRLAWENRVVNAAVEGCSQQYPWLSVDQRRTIAEEVRRVLQGYTQRDDSKVIGTAVGNALRYTVETWDQERRDADRAEQMRELANGRREAAVERVTHAVTGATESETLAMKRAACDALVRLPLSTPEWEIKLALENAVAPIANAIEQREIAKRGARDAVSAREVAEMRARIKETLANNERQGRESIRKTLIVTGELAIETRVRELVDADEIDRAALRDAKWHEELKAELRARLPHDAGESFDVTELARSIVDENLD
jgi:excisionase family DNA binding protein